MPSQVKDATISSLVSIASDPVEADRFVKVMASTSTVEQQNLTRLVLRFLSAMADNEYDSNNEVAVKVAQEIKAIDCCRYSCGHPGRSILDKELP